MKSLLIITTIFLKFSLNGYTQNNKYIVITIIKNNNVKLDGFSHTQWIIPIDSLSELKFNDELIHPLLVQNYSVDNLDDCKKNRPIAPFSYTTRTNLNFSDSASRNKGEILNLIDDKKKPIQVIKKKWSNGYKETIRIYATPVSGEFCFCKAQISTHEYFGDVKYIVLVLGKITYLSKFWSSEKSLFLKSIDFSIKNNFGQMWN
jgi:hypothetical protein